MYSALEQIVLSMGDPSPEIFYGLAVPDHRNWETQLTKIHHASESYCAYSCFLSHR